MGHDINQKSTMLNEIQAQTEKYYMISFICGIYLKNKTKQNPRSHHVVPLSACRPYYVDQSDFKHTSTNTHLTLPHKY